MAVEKDASLEELKTIEVARESEPELFCRDRSACKRPVFYLHEHTFLQRKPASITCPNCLSAIKTVVERQNTSTTHLFALLLVPLCLCAMPYWSKTLRNSVHRCPSCGVYLGSCFASAQEAVVLYFNADENNNDGPPKPI